MINETKEFKFNKDNWVHRASLRFILAREGESVSASYRFIFPHNEHNPQEVSEAKAKFNKLQSIIHEAISNNKLPDFSSFQTPTKDLSDYYEKILKKLKSKIKILEQSFTPEGIEQTKKDAKEYTEREKKCPSQRAAEFNNSNKNDMTISQITCNQSSFND